MPIGESSSLQPQKAEQIHSLFICDAFDENPAYNIIKKGNYSQMYRCPYGHLQILALILINILVSSTEGYMALHSTLTHNNSTSPVNSLYTPTIPLDHPQHKAPLICGRINVRLMRRELTVILCGGTKMNPLEWYLIMVKHEQPSTLSQWTSSLL